MVVLPVLIKNLKNIFIYFLMTEKVLSSSWLRVCLDLLSHVLIISTLRYCTTQGNRIMFIILYLWYQNCIMLVVLFLALEVNHEILNVLKYVRPGGGFVPKFPVFGKVEVNGLNEEPLFTYLKVVLTIFRMLLSFVFTSLMSIMIHGKIVLLSMP